MKILETTMRQMPKVFTSNEFNSQAVKNGYPKNLLKKRGLSKFISNYAVNEYYGSKTWTKKEVKQDTANELITEKEAISLLKRKGYKILKPVSEWVEC